MFEFQLTREVHRRYVEQKQAVQVADSLKLVGPDDSLADAISSIIQRARRHLGSARPGQETEDHPEP